MSILATLTILSLGLADSRQGVFHMSDKNGMSVEARSLSRVENGQSVSYILATGVIVKSAKQGLTLNAARVNAKTKKQVKGEFLSDATAIGKVVFDKTVSTPSSKQVTHITGTKADFLDGTSEATIKLAGPVLMDSNDNVKAQHLIATGANGSAIIDRLDRTEKNTGLRSAVLSGSVKIVVDRKKTAKQKALMLTAHADRATIENVGDAQRITLFDNITIEGADVPTSTGIKHAVITIDSEGNIGLKAEAS